MTCPHNQWNFLKWDHWVNYQKINNKNVKHNQTVRKKMFLMGQIKKKFLLGNFNFSVFLFRFIPFTLCEMHFEIVSSDFFARSEIVLICTVDSIRAAKIVFEQHISVKCEHGLSLDNAQEAWISWINLN